MFSCMWKWGERWTARSEWVVGCGPGHLPESHQVSVFGLYFKVLPCLYCECLCVTDANRQPKKVTSVFYFSQISLTPEAGKKKMPGRGPRRLVPQHLSKQPGGSLKPKVTSRMEKWNRDWIYFKNSWTGISNGQGKEDQNQALSWV